MRAMISILVAAVIALGVCYMYLKHAAPGGGALPTQEISTTGVEMDLTAIAQAERLAFAQSGAYASLEQLTSSGALTTRPVRDGYTYSVATSDGGFTVTASHPDVPAAVAGSTPLHYPTLAIDQNMQVRQGN